MGRNMHLTVWYVFHKEDGSFWRVPNSVIAKHRAKHYAHEYSGNVERSLAEDTLPLFKSDPAALHEWVGEAVAWKDVEKYAQQVIVSGGYKP